MLELEQRWASVVSEVLSPDAELLSVSRWIADSRAYGAENHVAIIRLVGEERTDAPLSAAADVLARLGRPSAYVNGRGWEALRMPRFEGQTLEFLLPNLSVARRIRVLRSVMSELASIHAKGISHRDLRPDNVIVGPRGRVELIDFDRAALEPPLTAALADWIGVGSRGLTENAFWSLALFTLAPRARPLARRVRSIVRRPRTYAETQTGAQGDSSVEVAQLARAWALAQRSNANAPGQGLAYYAFTYRGHHFPGERPWELRWDALRRSVDFEGRTVLELGCNLGLLSSFAVLHGARAALAVDRDEVILQGANLVADALGAGVAFRQLDLSSSDSWEENLPKADIVTALSLVRWLPDPRRIFAFLGRHREVIYEGHDSLSIETARLQAAGFSHVDVLLESERGRFVLHGHE